MTATSGFLKRVSRPVCPVCMLCPAHLARAVRLAYPVCTMCLKHHARLPLILAVSLALMLSTGCRSTGYERAAAERFEGPVTYVPSDGGAYVLAIEERPAADGAPLTDLRFFVYDTVSDSIAYERVSTFRGSVRWEDEHRVRVEETPGIVRLEDTSPNVYYVDARTGRRLESAPGGTER